MDEGALEFRRDECDRESNRTEYTISYSNEAAFAHHKKHRKSE
jgi:hypothetical protein